MRYASPRRAMLTAAFFAGAWTSGGFVGAQPVAAASRDVPFGRYIPASVPYFVTVRNLTALDRALGDVKAGQLLAQLSGSRDEEIRRADGRSVLQSFLGRESSIDLLTLTRLNAAVAIDSWSDTPHAVWFFRLRDTALVDEWFPQQRRAAQDTSRGALIFRTPDGLIVGQRDDILVLARRWVGDRLLVEIVQMLTGKPQASLEQSQHYQELATYLPAASLATIYVNGPADDQSAPAATRIAGLEMERFVIGLYASGNHIDLAIRGTRVHASAQKRLKPRAIGQMLRLPHTTLFAVTRAVDIDPAALAGKGGNELSRYARLLLSLRGLNKEGAESVSKLGPHVVFAWGQTLTGASDFPQVAVLVECEDSAELKAQLDGTLSNVTAAIRTLDPQQLASLSVAHETHLGVGVSYIPTVTIDDPARLGALRLLTDVQPAWAAWGNWMLLATHREHLKRILNAQFGLVPTLGSVPAARVIRPGQQGVAMMSVVQASTAAQQIDAWLSASSDDMPLWLDPIWWDSLLGADVLQSKSLGVRIERSYSPGQITVSTTVAETAAEGLLHQGDHIIGLNGSLIDLADPARDFRKQWRRRPRDAGPTIRVMRDGEAMDVVLPIVVDEEGDRPEFDPAPVLRKLVSLARGVSFAGLTVHATDERHYSARITLRLQERAKPEPVRPPRH